MRHGNPTVVVLHIHWEVIRALVIPRLHLVKFGRHHSVRQLRDSVLAVQLGFFVGGRQDSENGFFS